MRQFTYQIQNYLGIYGKPAGLLVKQAVRYQSKVHIQKDGKETELRRLLALLELNVRCGDIVTVTVSGGDEETAAAELEAYFVQHL